MGKVITLSTERWVQVFDAGGLRVDVSTDGRVKFLSGDDAVEGEPPILNMSQIVELTIALILAFESTDVIPKE